MASFEFNPQPNSDDLLAAAYDKPELQLRLLAMGNKRELVRLFLSGIITASETGDPRCSYHTDGTPMITTDLLAEIGGHLIEFSGDEDEIDQAADEFKRSVGLDDIEEFDSD